MRTKRSLLLASALCLALPALYACGGDDSAGDGGTPTGTDSGPGKDSGPGTHDSGPGPNDGGIPVDADTTHDGSTTDGGDASMGLTFNECFNKIFAAGKNTAPVKSICEGLPGQFTMTMPFTIP